MGPSELIREAERIAGELESLLERLESVDLSTWAREDAKRLLRSLRLIGEAALDYCVDAEMALGIDIEDYWPV